MVAGNLGKFPNRHTIDTGCSLIGFSFISPDEMNRHIRTVIVAPMTTAGKDYPTRIPCKFKKKNGQIVLDQIQTIDKTRLTKRLGSINPETELEVISVLQRLFAF